MTFMVYRTFISAGNTRLRRIENATFYLPQLLQNAWSIRQKQNEGWEASADELIQIHSNGTETYKTRRLLSDFHPTSTWRIGIIELQHVYAFTYCNERGTPDWTPFMVKGRDVFYNDNYKDLTPGKRKTILADLPEYSRNGSEFAEFLYVRVNDNGTWVWGRTGMTNAAFLQKDAREYFRPFF